MDSLRKRVPVTPRQIPRPIERPRPIFLKPLPQREEIFISSTEAKTLDKHFKKDEQKNKRRSKIKKVLKIFFMVSLASLFAIAIYFFWKTYNVSRKMNSQMLNKPTVSQSMRALASPIMDRNNLPALKGEDKGRINILLLGAAGQHKPGGNLTDTVMVMSIDTKEKKVALLSLPRDFYTPIGETKSFAKINSLYPIGIKDNKGVELIKEAVEKITNQTLNYYLVVDFDAFEKIINDIGGINIVSERDIYDATYPGPNYSYQTFSLSKGFHQLDGATTLKYVRERHDDPEGDFGRAKRQQQVIQAVKNKMFSLKTIFNVVAISNILDTLGNNVKTDITIQDMESFIALSKTLDLENINNVVIDAWKKDSLLKVSHAATASGNAFILIPRVGNYSEIQDISDNIFNQEELKRRKEMIANENAKVAIINQSGDYNLATKIRQLLSEKLDIKDVTVMQGPDNTIEQITSLHQKENSSKIFTLDELLKKIPAKLSDAPLVAEDGENDFVITLGSDLVEIYKYDEDSIEDFNKEQNSIDFVSQNQ